MFPIATKQIQKRFIIIIRAKFPELYLKIKTYCKSSTSSRAGYCHTENIFVNLVFVHNYVKQRKDGAPLVNQATGVTFIYSTLVSAHFNWVRLTSVGVSMRRFGLLHLLLKKFRIIVGETSTLHIFPIESVKAFVFKTLSFQKYY